MSEKKGEKKINDNVSSDIVVVYLHWTSINHTKSQSFSHSTGCSYIIHYEQSQLQDERDFPFLLLLHNIIYKFFTDLSSVF